MTQDRIDLLKAEWYELDIDSAGYIEDRATGFGFSAHRIPFPRYSHDMGSTVFVARGDVYMTQEVARYLIDTRYSPADLKVGRRGFYRLTEPFIAEAQDYIDYAPRSDREAEVDRRDLALLQWLLDHRTTDDVAQTVDAEARILNSREA